MGLPGLDHETTTTRLEVCHLTRVVFDDWQANLLLQLRAAPTNSGTADTDCVHAIATSSDAKTLRGNLRTLDPVRCIYHVLLHSIGTV